MTLHTIIEQCLPKEADHREWFSNLDLETKSAFRRRASSDADADLIYWGYNLCREHTNDSIPTIVELLIAEIENMEIHIDGNYAEFARQGFDNCKERVINLLKQK